MRYICRNEYLFTGAHDHSTFQFVPVVDRAFAFKKVRDCLDAPTVVSFSNRPTEIGSTFMQMCLMPTVSVEAPAP